MSATPTYIPIGTVASRVRAFQTNTQLDRNIRSPSPSISNIHTSKIHQLSPTGRQKQAGELSPTHGVPSWLHSSRPPIQLSIAARENHHRGENAPFHAIFSIKPPSRQSPTFGRTSYTCGGAQSKTPQGSNVADLDGGSDLATIRSQLKCIETLNDHHPPTPLLEVGVLGELDSMIQEAINAQGQEHKRTKAEQDLQDSSTCTNTDMTISPPISPVLQSLRLELGDPSELRQVYSGPRHRPRVKSESLKRPSNIGYKNLSRHTWTLPHEERAKLPQEILPDVKDVAEDGKDEIHSRRNRSSSMADITPSGIPSELATARKPRLFPRYYSLKALHREPSVNDNPGFNNVSTIIDSTEASSRTGKMGLPTSLTSDRRRSDFLIPLTLPQLVEQSRHQAALPPRVSEDKAEKDGNDDPDLGNSGNSEQVAPTKSNLIALRPAAFESGSTAGGKERVKKAHTGKNSSIIQSKIRELLRAAKQTRNDQCRNDDSLGDVKQSLLKENVRFDSLDASTLPACQLPIDEQAVFLKDDLGRSTPTQTKTLARSSTISSSSTPGRKFQQSFEPPRHHHPTRDRQPLSPRGPGYTFEQRFSVSPSRSHSRASQNAVRVSVELRRSPERQRPDDQLLLVRATVEPEDGEDFDEYS